MAHKFKGIRGLGLMDPVARSNMLAISRALKGIGAANRRFLPQEDSVVRQPGASGRSQPSFGGREAPVTFGKFSDRPTSTFMGSRGVGAAIYIATDTGVAYQWTGTAWSTI